MSSDTGFEFSGLRAERDDRTLPDRNAFYGEQPKNHCKRAVLLLHGMTGSPFEMQQYGKKLHKADFDVFCPCLPGHGENIQNVKEIKWQDWVNFAEEKYKELKQSYP